MGRGNSYSSSEQNTLSVSNALLGFVHSLVPALFGVQINVADVTAQAGRDAVFRAGSADVENWRFEAASHLEMSSNAAFLLLFGAKSERVPRCVKLNNYWCIKGKGWTGQLGSDGEGHAAFASAQAAARAAAILLRHYYVDLRRRSAMEITAHWAPDRCGSVLTRGRPPAPRSLVSPPSTALDVAKMSPRERMAAFDRIIGARRRAAAGQYRQRLQFVKAVNDGSAGRMPSMAAVSTKPSIAVARPTVAPFNPLFCGLEERRIASYARRALRGIAQASTEDLQLFTVDGRSTWRAAQMMRNMATVEIGPKAVDDNIVALALKELDDAMVPPLKKPGT